MSDILLMIGGFSIVAVPIAIIAWVIAALRKKPTKKPKIFTVVLIVVFILGESIGIATGCKHDFQPETTIPATCTNEGKNTLRCTKCDKSSYEKIASLEHNLVETERIDAAIGAEGAIVYQCSLCSHTEKVSLPALPEPEVTECAHDWTEATCTTPKSCKKCAVAEGEASGHQWSGVSCTEAKSCSVCGETDGEPLDHDWIAATCTSPETCSRCQAQRGNPGEHIWNDATCTTSKTCSVCGEMVGIAVGHSESSWIVQSADYVEALELSKKFCTLCGEELDQIYTSLEQLHDGEKFLWTPKEFVQRLNNKLEEINENNLYAASGSAGEKFACGLLADGESIGVLQFTDGEDAVVKEQENTQCIVTMLGSVQKPENFTRVVLAMIESCDPSLSFEEVRDIAKKATANREYSKNGITYIVSVIEEENGALIGFTVGE